jgi:phage-related protein (TIGR01555 family)
MSHNSQSLGGIALPTGHKQAVDGLVNVVSGLGTGETKRAHNTFQYGLLTDWQQLDAAYQTNWIARGIVEIPAGDMVREWRTIKSSGAEEIQAEEQRLQLSHKCEDALTWARLYGGGGILMLTNQDLRKPLDIRKIKKGDLSRLLVLDRYEMHSYSLNTYDILAENYLQPDFYTVQGGTTTIHWSHFARFHGAKLPRRQMAHTQGWGDSELRKCMEDLMDTISAKGGIAELMQEANVDVVKREGLADDLASDQDEAITERYRLFSLLKSVAHLALLDGDETYERKTLNLSGVAPILETLMIWISGCAKIPYTKLFRTSAKGMNATGEGDEKTYNDDIRAGQKTQLGMPLSYLDQVLVRSALGDMPKDYDYIWNPLSQPDVVETAQAGLLKAQRDRENLDAGFIRISQVQKNLQADETYQFTEGQIEAQEQAEQADPLSIPPNGDLDEGESEGEGKSENDE